MQSQPSIRSLNRISAKTARCKRRRLDLEQLEERRVFAIDPTGIEQELMQLVNRFRTDPQNEFSRLISSVSPRKAFDPNVDFSLSFFNTNVAVVQSQMSALTPVAPIAWDEIAQQVAIDYLPYMIAAKSSSHTLNGTFQQRIGRYPFDFTLGGTARENVFINAFSPIHAHAAYVIDWGSGPDGLQASGHRNNLINPDIKSGGMAFQSVTYEPAIGFGPMVNAQDLMGLGVTRPTVTGAIFEDRNGSGWYDAGEGLSGIQLDFRGTAGSFKFSAMSAGGYNAVVPAGTYNVTATGGAMKFPMTISNVVVGAKNVWLNFKYDPNSVPPDPFESNNTTASATLLTGNDQTLTGGTISQGDVDYFKLPANTTGLLTADLQFPAANGDLDIRLLNAAGAEIARANSSTSREILTGSILAGQDYYLVVESHSGGIGGAYTLQIDVPATQAAEGRVDSATTSTSDSPIIIDVLANDRDPDGDLNRATIAIVNAGAGNVEVINNGARPALRYTASNRFAGMDRISYTITDQQGLVSRATNVEVMVIDFAAPTPFQNARSPLDVNADGALTAFDALLIINQLNSGMIGTLPSSPSAARSIFGYIDVNGSGTLEPLDALLVINALNIAAGGEGEAAPEATSTDPRAVAADLYFDSLEQRPVRRTPSPSLRTRL